MQEDLCSEKEFVDLLCTYPPTILNLQLLALHGVLFLGLLHGDTYRPMVDLDNISIEPRLGKANTLSLHT
jgi:hypothetical protein